MSVSGGAIGNYYSKNPCPCVGVVGCIWQTVATHNRSWGAFCVSICTRCTYTPRNLTWNRKIWVSKFGISFSKGLFSGEPCSTSLHFFSYVPIPLLFVVRSDDPSFGPRYDSTIFSALVLIGEDTWSIELPTENTMFWIFVWTLVEVTSLSPFLLFAISDQNLLYGITSHFQQSESRENYRSEAKVNQKS